MHCLQFGKTGDVGICVQGQTKIHCTVHCFYSLARLVMLGFVFMDRLRYTTLVHCLQFGKTGDVGIGVQGQTKIHCTSALFAVW